MEALKEAGKDVWKAFKKKLWPESSSSEEGERLSAGTIKMTFEVGRLEESDGLEGAPSEAQVEHFVVEKPVGLYRKVQSRRNLPAKDSSGTSAKEHALQRASRRKERVSIKLAYTPKGSSESSAGKG